MKNYEAKKPSYFATPSPQLIHALHTALTQILVNPIADRFAAHKAGSDKIKAAVTALGLKQVAANPAEQAHGMTAIYLPENVKGADLLPKLANAGVIFAGGIHKEIAAKYIRFGHMGVSLVSFVPSDEGRAGRVLTTFICSLTPSGLISHTPSRRWRRAWLHVAIPRGSRRGVREKVSRLDVHREQ